VCRRELDSSASGQGTVSGFYEHGDELSVFVKGEVLLDSVLSVFPQRVSQSWLYFWLVTLVTSTPNRALTSFLPWSVVADNGY